MPKTDFECVICGEGKLEALPRWIDDSRICDECAEECVAPRFHDALQYEHRYPPLFGNVVMDIWTFWDLFDGDFTDAWRKKLQEYSVPVKSRLYCEQRNGVGGTICGTYLGTKEPGSGSVCCSECRCFTCKRCGAGSNDVSSAKTHLCQEVEKEDPFEKLSKGRDYQQCPGCKKEIVQGEGCNHMVCVPSCGTHFCFVCGQQVIARRSGHWMKDNCPRFGVEGKRLFWDNDGEHSVASSEESEGDEDFENDETESLDSDSAEQIDIELLIERFDQAREAEQLEDTRARLTRLPRVRRESRANFFGYIGLNLAIVDQVREVRFQPEDAANILEEFGNRDRRIIRQLRLYQSAVQPEAGVTELSDLVDELNSYAWYASETIERLAHMVGQEAERVARVNLDPRLW